MYVKQCEGLYQEGLCEVRVHLKSGKEAVYHNVHCIQTIKVGTGEVYLEVLYETKSILDTKYFPKESVDWFETAYDKKGEKELFPVSRKP